MQHCDGEDLKSVATSSIHSFMAQTVPVIDLFAGPTETMVIVDPSSPNGVRPLANSQIPAEAADKR